MPTPADRAGRRRSRTRGVLQGPAEFGPPVSGIAAVDVAGIDDPNAGWKGRGLWANYGTHLIWHVEGGKGTLGKAVHFQIRPDTLAH